MHTTQKALLELSKTYDLSQLSYWKIARLVGVTHAQTIKYHLQQLEKKGLISIDKESGVVEKIKQGVSRMSGLVAIPVYGAADCGSPTKLADNYIQGHIRVSSTLVPYKKGLFAVVADGHSMNKAKVGRSKRNIEPGDYVIVDGDVKTPENGTYVLSVIDALANIKKFHLDEESKQVVLASESTKDYPPIYISEEEIDTYVLSGKVIEVIKKLKM